MSLPNPDATEFTIDRRTGQVRQAGASSPAGKYVMEFKKAAEENLFVFAKGVLGLDRLQRPLHTSVATWLQRIPNVTGDGSYRKLLLIPRDHLKTSICSRSLPIHLLIQPKEHNVYRPGEDGRNARILLATETVDLAKKQLRWIENRMESCEILRALWPHCVWANSRRDSKKWTEEAMLIPRTEDYPENSVEVAGVGTAITGRHYTIQIFDDLVTFEASRSQLVMSEAIEWFKASRALMDDPDTGLEFTLGTKWAVYDLYAEIMNNDTSVECKVMSAIENGEVIFPRPHLKNWGFTKSNLAQLQRELGSRFFLLYMNSTENPELCPIDMTQVRTFTVHEGKVAFAEESRDLRLDDTLPLDPRTQSQVRGIKSDSTNYDATLGRIEYLRRGKSL